MILSARVVRLPSFRQVYLDSELSRSFESYAGSTFNTIGVAGTGVRNVVLESTFLAPGEWISLLEVRAAL